MKPTPFAPIDKKPNQHGFYRRQFSTLADMIDMAEQLPASFPERNRPGWTFGTEFPDAATTFAALRDGRASSLALKFAEQAREKTLASIETKQLAATRRRRHVFSESGDEVCVDRMLANHEQPWRTTRIGRASSVVRLGICATESYQNSETDFAKTIGEVAAAADVLTAAGFACELIGMESVRITKNKRLTELETIVYDWTIKAAHEPLDLSRVCSIASPGLLRCATFRVWDLDAPNMRHYGVCLPPGQAVREALGLDYMVGRWWADRGGKSLSQVQALGEIIAGGTVAV